MALENLLRLHELTGDDRWRAQAEALLRAFAPALAGNPQMLPRMLCGLDLALDRPKEIVIITPPGGGARDLLAALHARFVPNRVLVVVAEGAPQRSLAKTVPLVEEKVAQDGRATAYVCERRVCQRPTTEPEGFARELERVTPLS